MIERKKLETINTILSFIAAFIMMIFALAVDDNQILFGLASLLYGYCLLKMIIYGSTYNIDKFEYKYTYVVIFISGTFFGLIGALIAYFLIKRKELKLNEWRNFWYIFMVKRT